MPVDLLEAKERAKEFEDRFSAEQKKNLENIARENLGADANITKAIKLTMLSLATTDLINKEHFGWKERQRYTDTNYLYVKAALILQDNKTFKRLTESTKGVYR